MVDQFINPISITFNLLEQYKKLLKDNLGHHGLSPADQESVLHDFDLHSGPFISINRRHRKSNISFRQFCQDNGIDLRIPESLTFEHLCLHQEKAIFSILRGHATIVTTGTGSGKTATFLIPILDYCLGHPGIGVKALIIYPTNALANDQIEDIKKINKNLGYPIRICMLIGDIPRKNEKPFMKDPLTS